MPRLTVGVIFGGRSVEHEISLLSAKSIVKHINPEKFEVFPILIDKRGIWRTVSIAEWLKDGELEVSNNSVLTPSLNPENHEFYEISGGELLSRHRVDVIFPVLHGTYGEDGAVQGMFELMGVPYVGASVLGSSVGMDKIIMKAVLRYSGLPVVDYTGFYKHEWESGRDALRNRIFKQTGVPCFVKSADLGSSVGITKVKSPGDLDKAIDFSCRFSNRVLVEKAVAKPREIEISVLGNENPIASCPGEVLPHREFYDYRAKYLEEGTGLIAPAGLDEETTKRLRDYAVKTFKALDCRGLGRVDFLIDGDTDEIYISEINTMPGFTQISMYPRLWELSGIEYSDLVSRLIELAFEAREIKDSLESDVAESQKPL